MMIAVPLAVPATGAYIVSVGLWILEMRPAFSCFSGEASACKPGTPSGYSAITVGSAARSAICETASAKRPSGRRKAERKRLKARTRPRDNRRSDEERETTDGRRWTHMDEQPKHCGRCC